MLIFDIPPKDPVLIGSSQVIKIHKSICTFNGVNHSNQLSRSYKLHLPRIIDYIFTAFINNIHKLVKTKILKTDHIILFIIKKSYYISLAQMDLEDITTFLKQDLLKGELSIDLRSNIMSLVVGAPDLDGVSIDDDALFLLNQMLVKFLSKMIMSFKLSSSYRQFNPSNIRNFIYACFPDKLLRDLDLECGDH